MSNEHDNNEWGVVCNDCRNQMSRRKLLKLANNLTEEKIILCGLIQHIGDLFMELDKKDYDFLNDKDEFAEIICASFKANLYARTGELE